MSSFYGKSLQRFCQQQFFFSILLATLNLAWNILSTHMRFSPAMLFAEYFVISIRKGCTFDSFQQKLLKIRANTFMGGAESLTVLKILKLQMHL